MAIYPGASGAQQPGGHGAAEQPRLGHMIGPYAKLWSAASVSYVGDGIYHTALPLLAASMTRDPLAVASIQVAAHIPWLLVALPGGVLVDRWDRCRVLWITDAYRAALLAVLAASVLAGWASVPLLATIGFLLGIGGALFNPAAMSIVPAIVTREPLRLARANGRLAASQTVGEHFLGPPVGGLLFALSRPLPFLADAISFAISAVLIATIPGRFAPRTDGTPRSLRAELAEGVRWLAGHRLLRALAAMIAVSSVAFAAWTSIMVLFAQEHLGLGSVGYGLLWTGVAVGSVSGGVLAPRLSRLLGEGRLLLISSLMFGVASTGIGVSTDPWLAGVLLGIIGMALTTWNVVVVSLRQAIAPDRLVGRVNSVFQFLYFGSYPLGAVLGGLIGRAVDLRAPFLVSGVILLVMAVFVARLATQREIDAARAGSSADTSTVAAGRSPVLQPCQGPDRRGRSG